MKIIHTCFIVLLALGFTGSQSAALSVPGSGLKTPACLERPARQDGLRWRYPWRTGLSRRLAEKRACPVPCRRARASLPAPLQETLLAAASSGASPKNLAAASFPAGTYTLCAQGVHSPAGNLFLNAAGFQSGAVLTLAQRGTIVTASYVDQNGLTQSLSFGVTVGTSATLAGPRPVMAGFSSVCVLGPGIHGTYPATLEVTAGALTYDAGMVFVTLTGALQSNAGECGARSTPEAAFWLLCEDRHGGAPPSASVAIPPATRYPAGEYSCNSQVATYGRANGINNFVAAGASGTLTLAQDGAKVSVRYADDPLVSGTLRLGLTTATTASAEAGQTLMSPCMVPNGSGGPFKSPEPLPIAAGSLAVVDSKLFLSFAGTTDAGSSCPGAHVAGTVICTTQLPRHRSLSP